MRFSLVIPCYNRAHILPQLLDRSRILASRPGNEVIFVDNGSTDDSARVLADLLPGYPGCRGIRVRWHQGEGFGILAGLAVSKGQILGWTDADSRTDPHVALRGLEVFERHVQPIFVKGRRYGRPLADTLLTAGMSGFETLLLRTRLRDINAQPTMFTRQFYDSWSEPPRDASLDLFAYYQARKAGLAVHRFPVRAGARAKDWAARRKSIRRTIDFSLQLKTRLRPE